MPIPNVRITKNKKPPPFKRPSITVTTEPREWRTVPVGQLKPGDTVPDVGVLESVEVVDSRIFVRGVEQGKAFNLSDQVLAFVVKTDG